MGIHCVWVCHTGPSVHGLVCSIYGMVCTTNCVALRLLSQGYHMYYLQGTEASIARTVGTAGHAPAYLGQESSQDKPGVRRGQNFLFEP
ncbi:hypothetical protein EON63_18760 [archaeon]|nr:MAG: hypothetical protein EON63_18760 [archaeon]